MAYLVDLTFELEMLTKDAFTLLNKMSARLVPQLEALVESVAQLLSEERQAKRRARTARVEKPKA